MFKVSHSKVKTWRRCHKAYDYKYNQKLEPKRKQRPLVFGSVIHEMIEANANGDNPSIVLKKYRAETKKMFSAEVDDYLQIIKDAEALMEHYFSYYAKDNMKFIAIKGKLAEHEFEVPITKGIILKGKIDAFMRSKDKRVWLTEHKSHKEIPSEDIRWRDIQTATYYEVTGALGIKQVDGILWDYVRSKPPSVPELLKNGGLSKAKIDTLPSVYMDAIKEHKLNPKDYKEILDNLRGREENYFKRVFMPISSDLTALLMKETIQTAQEMQDRGKSDCTRNISRDCSWCSYEGLCRAELMGLDADFIRSKEFTIKADETKQELNG
jgi:hypothetical protein